ANVDQGHLSNCNFMEVIELDFGVDFAYGFSIEQTPAIIYEDNAAHWLTDVIFSTS
ncbi:hypothetical protein ACJX0J_009103, partial [Zea mays]